VSNGRGTTGVTAAGTGQASHHFTGEAKMAKFEKDTKRVAPYPNNRFKLKIGTRYVAGLNKCSSLKKTTEKVDWFESGNPSSPFRLPGKTSYEAITLTAGVTHDREFEEWANQVNNFQGDAAISLKSFRKDLTIEIYNEEGQIVMAYQVFRCWVSEYQALPELDAGGNAVMVQTIKLENEGWQRDPAVVEPDLLEP
jgi:phage tail-like protein